MVWLLAGSRSQPALPASQSLSLTNHKSIAGVEKCDGAGAGQHGDTQTGPGRDSLANATALWGIGGRVMPHSHAGPGGSGHSSQDWLQGPAPSVESRQDSLSETQRWRHQGPATAHKLSHLPAILPV